MIRDIIKIILGTLIAIIVFKLLIMLLGIFFYIVTGLLLIIFVLVFLACIGENTSNNDCPYANSCPSSVRCNGTYNKSCDNIIHKKED